MTVYADAVFLTGAVMQIPPVWLTLRLTGLRRPFFSTAAFCLASGAVSVMLLYPQIPTPLCLLASVACCVLFFRGKTVWGTLRNVGRYAAILFVSVAAAVTTMLRLSPQWTDGYAVVPWWSVLCGVGASAGVSAAVIARRRKACGVCASCEIVTDQVRIPLRCYYDTGNFLTEPISGLPVVIVEYAFLRRRFPDGLPPPMSYDFARRFSDRYRVVRYRSVSGDGEMLAAFLPDAFRINGTERKAVIAVTERYLETGGRFYGIFGSDLWEGTEE